MSGEHTRRRSDAERNRERLVTAALQAFSAGTEQVPLESIARDAGVGIGTLYRHFPSREALIEAVYRSELARLCDRAPADARRHPADRSLRRWMARYADFVGTKRGMAEALRAVIASGAITSEQTRERLADAVGVLLAAGEQDGSLRADVAAADVVAGMAGAMLACREPHQRAQLDRLLDLLVDGLRPAAREGTRARRRGSA